jgi:hypothetical protein
VHRYKADEAYQVGLGKGPLGAYLAYDEIVEMAVKHNVDAIHPGARAGARLRDATPRAPGRSALRAPWRRSGEWVRTAWGLWSFRACRPPCVATSARPRRAR